MCLGPAAQLPREQHSVGQVPLLELLRSPSSKGWGWSAGGSLPQSGTPTKKRSQVRPGLGRSNLRGSSYGAVGMRDDNQDRQEAGERKIQRDPEDAGKPFMSRRRLSTTTVKPAHAATLLPAAGKPWQALIHTAIKLIF